MQNTVLNSLCCFLGIWPPCVASFHSFFLWCTSQAEIEEVGTNNWWFGTFLSQRYLCICKHHYVVGISTSTWLIFVLLFSSAISNNQPSQVRPWLACICHVSVLLEKLHTGIWQTCLGRLGITCFYRSCFLKVCIF